MSAMFRLRPRTSSLRRLGCEYDYQNDDAELRRRQDAVKNRGHLTKGDLQAVGNWKSLRSAGRIKANSNRFVTEISRFALSTKSERARVEALTLLSGVSWPTASVVLHFFHRGRYPILDYRALWSLGVEDEPYRFDFWWSYVEFTRDLARRTNLDMRTLDKALWQYSKEHQP